MLNSETLRTLLDFLQDKLLPEDIEAVQSILSSDAAAEDDDPEPTASVGKPSGTPRPLTTNGTPAMDHSTAAFIQDLRLAEQETKPILGDVPPQRLPSDYYRLALDARGVATAALPAGAMRAVFRSPGGSRPGMAYDAKAAKAFAQRFPGAGSLKIR